MTNGWNVCAITPTRTVHKCTQLNQAPDKCYIACPGVEEQPRANAFALVKINYAHIFYHRIVDDSLNFRIINQVENCVYEFIHNSFDCELCAFNYSWDPFVSSRFEL